MSTNVGEQFPVEVKRCEDLLQAYRDIGPAGAFGVANLTQVIRVAKAAWESGDVVRIVKAFAVMRSCE